jgi:F-type H+-transporting ATPase subunit b
VNSALAQFGSSSSGIGALGFDGKAFVIQLITFILAYLVLRRWAFGPIMRVLHERRETIENGVKMGEQLQKEKLELEAKIEKTLQETRVQADGILAEARDAAQASIHDAEEAARAKAAGIAQAAEDRLIQDTARARQQLEQEVVCLIADATETIIDEKIDAKKDAKLIERALKGKA